MNLEIGPNPRGRVFTAAVQMFPYFDVNLLTYFYFYFAALKASGSRLWIGTANGVILSIPFSDPSSSDGGPETDSERRRSSLRQASSSISTPVIVTTTSSSGTAGDGRGEERLAVSTFVPTCNTSAAQLSFHGHRDAVKFFVCTKNLIMSGGDGYIDFRVDEEDPSVITSSTSSSLVHLAKGDRSHLIVWELMQQGNSSQAASSSSS